ncbi:sigma factor-like helix-turn-helix DNA-binding protein [Deinococcus hopiensis]|uniref:sigma factor-like helix-turn-helix DNA-binding protein n=1 Tax=Deinococcus hopiensis TaxID=309885 RepID=UPI0009FFE0AC
MLGAREAQVLRMRKDLADGREPTVEEVGHHFKVTRERTRQIGDKALRKLKYRHERRRTLRDDLQAGLRRAQGRCGRINSPCG